MSYTALYRKFRPQEFEDVKGQEHIVTTLKNQIKAERIGHAYLFCGTRGTGKTTIAKIFARAVNCEHPVDGSPCGECPTCKSIAAGTSMNVIEIDAASNNGVDIIDEVHMLSIGAFNALLKTLEEPPSYVIFILATTEFHKIPITILSRCQRYDFRRISVDTISQRLQELMKRESVTIEEKAVRYLAKAADGSMRDALSLLDQCIAFYLGQDLTYDRVLEVLGAVDAEVFSRLLRFVLQENVAGIIRLLEEMVMEGRELGQFVNDFTWYLRNLLLLKGCDEMEDVLDISSENLSLLKEEAEMTRMDALIRYIRVFSELSNQVKYSSQKRILIEVALIKLCKPEMETNADSVNDRLAKLERRMEEGIPAAVQAAEHPAEEENDVRGPRLAKAVSQEVQQIVRSWNSILQDMPGMIKVYLKQARLSLGGDNRLMIVLDDPVAFELLGREDHKKEIEKIISDRIDREVEVSVQLNSSRRPFEETYVDLEQLIHMEIEIEE